MKHWLLLFLGGAFVGLAAAQQFDISAQGPVLLGDPVTVALRGFAPNQPVRVVAERVFRDQASGQRMIHRSHATFQADANGKVDLAQSMPTKGSSYQAADARGLFWSMVPTQDVAADDRPSLEVRFSARAADKADATDGPTLAQGTVTFITARPDVNTEKVSDFPGAVFASQGGPNKRPALIILGGSEGGAAITSGAAPLASHGLAVLALPYYSPKNGSPAKQEVEGLPANFDRIPVERLNAARAWLRKRADVDGSRIGVMGTSKGAELALLAGAYLGWPSVVVAMVPTDVVWEGWGEDVDEGKHPSFAMNGRALPFVPYGDVQAELKGFQTGDPVRFRRPSEQGRTAHPAAAVAARIPVERIKAPLLVVGGHDDQVWPSGAMAQNIAERRVGVKHETLALIYSGAGHAIGGTGYGPTTQHNEALFKMGGNPADDARAQADAWPKTLAFLKKHLNVK
jgi:dienelactone hydrolase